MDKPIAGGATAQDDLLLHETGTASFLDELGNHVGDIFLERYGSIRDFAQGSDRRFVLALDGRGGTAGDLSRAFSSEDDEGKTIGDLLETIFNSYASHGKPFEGLQETEYMPTAPAMYWHQRSGGELS